MNDWERMQREAEQRVKNSRARNNMRVGKEVSVPEFVRTPKTVSTPNSPSKGLFDLLNIKNFDIDSDRSLVLMMLALLSGEQNDELLTLALLYIML